MALEAVALVLLAMEKEIMESLYGESLPEVMEEENLLLDLVLVVMSVYRAVM
jgi:hypothetical protein